MKRLFLSAVFGAAVAVSGAASAGTLDDVKARGVLNCGSNTGLAGFGQPDAHGNCNGFHVDMSRAVAAPVFGDGSKVKFTPLSAKDRFTALQSKEVDLLVRNTTWTSSRDTSLGLNFTGVTYYDGQGFMVRKKLKVNSALELSGASVCTQQGTTTELNVADFFRSKNMKFEAVVFATSDETIKAYDAGRCDAFTTDASGLYSERLRLANADDHLVLPEVISKEPLGPAVRHGDDQWFDIVKWTQSVLVNAEEMGVTKANVDQMKTSTNPDVKRMLGTEGDFGKSLGLNNDFAVGVIKAVGNYGELFERTLGTGSQLKIARGVNQLWNKGGLQYAPPIR